MDRGAVVGIILLLTNGLLAGATAAEPKRVGVSPLSGLVSYPLGSAPATVVSLNDSRIVAEIDATVEEIPARVGAVVGAGDTLLRLDCRDHESRRAAGAATVEALEARAEFADYQYRRAESLLKSKGISDEQFNQRRAEARAMAAELRGARAQHEQTRRDVARCSVDAPFRAVVMEQLVGVGERVGPGKPLLRLVDLDALEVSAQIPAFDADALDSAQQFTLQIGAGEYPLVLERLTPALDRISRTREARLGFSAEAALPGSSGRLLWRLRQPHIPAQYILKRDGGYGIFVAEGERVRFVPMAGAEEGRAAPVQLPLDTRIVTEGRHALRDGDPIAPVE